jgi:hypothetical protein
MDEQSDDGDSDRSRSLSTSSKRTKRSDSVHSDDDEKEKSEFIKTAELLTLLVEKDLPDMEPPTKKKSRNLSLVQTAMEESTTLTPAFPWAKGILKEMIKCCESAPTYKPKDTRLIKHKGLIKFYYPLKDRGVECPMSKLVPEIDHEAVGVFKCPSKGMPVTYSPANHDHLVKPTRSSCMIASYQDGALKGAFATISGAVKINNKRDHHYRLQVDQLLGKAFTMFESIGRAWTDNVRVLAPLLASLTMAQRDAVLSTAPSSIREAELTELRRQPVMTDKLFNGHLHTMEVEEMISKRLSVEALTSLAKARTKESQSQRPQQKKRTTTPLKKAVPGGGQQAPHQQSAQQAGGYYNTPNQQDRGYNGGGYQNNQNSNSNHRGRGGGGGGGPSRGSGGGNNNNSRRGRGKR